MSPLPLSYRTLLIAAASVGVILLLVGLWTELRSESRDLQALEASLATLEATPPPAPAAMRPPLLSSLGDAPSLAASPAPASQPSAAPAPDEEMVEVEEPAPTPEPLIVPAAIHPARAAVSVSQDEQAVLTEAAQQFSTALQGMNSYAPGYREAWQKAAQDADDLFKVRYGEDRLWAIKGGPPPPTPTPTPLSPEDDAYRAKYGDDALLVHQLERATNVSR